MKSRIGLRFWAATTLKDLSNQRFGRLVAQWPSGRKNKRVRWLCLCDCGEILPAVPTDTLTSGNTKSCGCLQREAAAKNGAARRLPNSGSAFNALFHAYTKAAKERDLEFLLTREQFRLLISFPCVYCGCPPSQIRKAGPVELIFTGIDRKNNNRGYDVENSVPCCKTCNFMKVKLGAEEFVAACRAVAQHQNQKLLEASLPKLAKG